MCQVNDLTTNAMAFLRVLSISPLIQPAGLASPFISTCFSQYTIQGMDELVQGHTVLPGKNNTGMMRVTLAKDKKISNVISKNSATLGGRAE